MVMYNLFTHDLSLIQVEQELAMAKKKKKTTMTSQQEIRAIWLCTSIHVNVLRLICIPSKAEMVSLIPLSKLVISF